MSVDRAGERAVPAAAFAALAESGLLYLPVRLVSLEVLGATAGPFASFPLFVMLVVAGAALATRFRRARAMPLFVLGAAMLLALVQAVLSDATPDVAAGISILLGVGVALRVASLGIRDWRNPVAASFGWGAVALLVEMAATAGAGPGWEFLLALIVPAFFAGSLASRAMSVRLSDLSAATVVDDAGEVAEEGGTTPRMVAGLIGALLGVVAVGAALGLEGGLFARIGAGVWAVAVWAIVAVALVLAVLATPLTFLLRGLHLDIAAGLQRIASQIRRVGIKGRSSPVAPATQTPWLGRALGFVAVLTVLVVVWRVIRSRRRPPDWDLTRRAQPGSLATRAADPELPERGAVRRRRADLPEDTVRRWYAEMLVLLQTRGMVRPGPATPREYVETVAAAFPASRESFGSLTRAYEAVRYGGRSPDRSGLRTIRADREAAAAVIRKAKRADLPAQGGDRDDADAEEHGDLRG